MKLNNVLLTIFAVSLTACDCEVDEIGYVLDGKTGQALTNVTVKFDTKTYQTDETGLFHIQYATGICPDRYFVFEKKNYRPMEITIKRDGDDLTYTINAKKASIDYETPVYLDSTKKSFITSGWVELTSKNFGVKNDTLIIYLDK